MADYNPIRSVDGKAIKCPSGYKYSLNDISASDAGRTEDTVLLHAFDLDAIQKDRLEWGLFRDRRPEQYGAISSPIPVQI